ncbi:Cell division inhibitor SulA [Escherichia coli]|nr:Cell division inhibitor SulA [Escherichia coli]
MYTSGYAHRSSSFSSAASKIARVSTENTTAGLISEVVYREDQPMMTQLLLLPLLQQLGQQSRWQLWLTPQQKLSREWVQASGLPLTKVMQISQLSPCHTVESMVRALRTGNYSVVIGWLADDLTEEEHAELVDAANEGNAMGFIMRPVSASSHATRQLSGLKIHSNLYHCKFRINPGTFFVAQPMLSVVTNFPCGGLSEAVSAIFFCKLSLTKKIKHTLYKTFFSYA